MFTLNTALVFVSLLVLLPLFASLVVLSAFWLFLVGAVWVVALLLAGSIVYSRI